MQISWEEANQLMAEVINFFNDKGIDSTSLKSSNPDEYEQLANVLRAHNDKTWSSHSQSWIIPLTINDIDL